MPLAFLPSLYLRSLALPLAACVFLAHSRTHTHLHMRACVHTRTDTQAARQTDATQWQGEREGGSLALNNTGTGSDPLMEWSGWGWTQEREMWGRCDVSAHVAAAIGRGHSCHHCVHLHLLATCTVMGGGGAYFRVVKFCYKSTEVGVVQPRVGVFEETLKTELKVSKCSSWAFLPFQIFT